MVFYLIIIGAAAGFIATRMMRLELGVIQTVALGIIGALVGGLVLRGLLALMGMAAGLIGAIIAVMILVYLYRNFFEN